MNEVFDLTSGDYNSGLVKFIVKRRKDYVVHEPENEKIKVTFTTEDNEQYSCIYFYKSNKEVYDMIRKEEPLDLRFTYIKDSDISMIDTLENYKLNNFDASFSFWDGKINFTSAQFEDRRVNFSGSNFRDGNVDFSGANFGDGFVDFRFVQFGDGFVGFSKAHFGDGFVDFSSAHFENGSVDFSSAQFGDGDVTFRFANSRDGDVTFRSAIFGDGYVNFSDAQFGDGYVSFSDAQFGDGIIDFYNATFGNGNVNFSDTQFGDGIVDFSDAQFGDGDVDFRRAQFGDGDVDFSRAQFGDGDVTFRSANFRDGDVDFSRAQFGDGDVNFYDSSSQSITFYRNTFPSHVDLRLNKIEELIVEDCIIEKTIKCQSSVRYKKLSFLNTVNLGQIYINWNNNTMFDAINNGIKISMAPDKEDRPFTSEEKASQFRMLKENFHNIGYYDDEDCAYKAYMDCKTESLDWFREAFIEGKQKNLLKGIRKGIGSVAYSRNCSTKHSV